MNPAESRAAPARELQTVVPRSRSCDRESSRWDAEFPAGVSEQVDAVKLSTSITAGAAGMATSHDKRCHTQVNPDR